MSTAMTSSGSCTSAQSCSATAQMIRHGTELALQYADALLKGITAETFAHMPIRGAGRDINSPAFNFGHLAIYPDLRILPLLGRDDLVRPLPFSADLFKAGAPCVDQPGLYPAMDVIVSTFQTRYRAALEALQGVSDELLARPNPTEGRSRELFPLIGSAMVFLFVGHTQSHLGQVSVWRRMMGLGSAF